MPQIDSLCQSVVRGLRPTGVPVRGLFVEGAGLLGLLLCVLPLLIGCHVNGPHPLGTIADPGTFAEPPTGAMAKEIRVAAEASRPGMRPTAREEGLADRHVESLCGDWPSVLIGMREVEPSSEPIKPAAYATFSAEEADVPQEPDAPEERVAQATGSTPDRAVSLPPDDDRMASILAAIAILKTADEREQPSEPESDFGVSMRIAGEFDLLEPATDSVDDAPVSTAAHLQKLEQDDTTDVLQPIEPSADVGEEVDDPDKRSVGDITIDVLPKTGDELPPNLALDEGRFLPYETATEGTYTGRGWSYCMYQWEASGLCHRPLYFEEVNLERYGYSRFSAAQPVISGARFFATVCTLPYQMTTQPPREHVYTLGYYRPGSCAPYQVHRPPLEPKAGAIEGGVIAGLIFAVP
ncbi:MAG: hypothetical protein HQ567_09780 [Candidatus Nealsonbacteria bacterium]|nr:hypothetical protein [Candidatus Nealsonbacteria bacterium]